MPCELAWGFADEFHDHFAIKPDALFGTVYFCACFFPKIEGDGIHEGHADVFEYPHGGIMDFLHLFFGDPVDGVNGIFDFLEGHF